MNICHTRTCAYWAAHALLALSLALNAGCSSKHGKAGYYTATGSKCYAKAVPTQGEGGLAWGDSLGSAQQKSLSNCIRYAGRSGGTPDTCKVVLAKCKS